MARKNKKSVEVNEAAVVEEAAALEEVADVSEETVATQETVASEEVTVTSEEAAVTEERNAPIHRTVIEIQDDLDRLDIEMAKLRDRKEKLFVSHHLLYLKDTFTKKVIKTLNTTVNRGEGFIEVTTKLPNSNKTFVSKYELSSEDPFENVVTEYVEN